MIHILSISSMVNALLSLEKYDDNELSAQKIERELQIPRSEIRVNGTQLGFYPISPQEFVFFKVYFVNLWSI